MHKWYIIEPSEAVMPLTKSVLVQERNGKIYEVYVEGLDGKCWKSTADNLFCYGYDVERFKRFCKLNEDMVREVTKEEAFTMML